MLKEENIDFRNKSSQLYETLKKKKKDLKEAEECIQYLKEKSKQVFQNEHHNDLTYTSYSQRPDEQPDKRFIKTNHTNPTNQISSNNQSDHRQISQLMPKNNICQCHRYQVQNAITKTK